MIPFRRAVGRIEFSALTESQSAEFSIEATENFSNNDWRYHGDNYYRRDWYGNHGNSYYRRDWYGNHDNYYRRDWYGNHDNYY
ncbi:hypothetical protein CONCODRAFT_13551 [Conidiobolus coronatus NRRL 28638]|uniref:Uncharacterized protein n=1 Tax=Conidiobolus coronatus (strain ATCC 28846 / CBS 209.66 / NRRL 28638) TaxID=796925 RepID=A0A137NQM5_CONC2|nr:hypothetical protein CONCODRAFT_13551 [Conidiobolus coronatus NRRL 28638]|eukprot:KXN65018.1 hypothetical protein CONCODRAFT_13551 [Conidiobolus coronatus NRRL 28638]